MDNDISGKTILITGGTGSIGSELAKQVLDHDVERIIVFSRDEVKHFMLKKRIVDDRLVTTVGDVRNYRSIGRVFEKYDIDLIYHAAAMKHVVICDEAPIECIDTNVYGTQNVIDLSLKYNVPKLITISTDKSACPVNVMGAAKYIAERITLNSNYSCVRFGNVANSRGSVVPVLIDCLLNMKPLTITDTDATRFIMGIPDAVELILKATEYSQGGDLFILKMRAFKLGDMLDVILDRIAPKLNIPAENIEVRRTGLIPGEKLHEDLINSTESSRTYDCGEMYIVLRDNEDAVRYSGIEMAYLTEYSSEFAEKISKDEIERIISQYLRKGHIGDGPKNAILQR